MIGLLKFKIYSRQLTESESSGRANAVDQHTTVPMFTNRATMNREWPSQPIREQMFATSDMRH